MGRETLAVTLLDHGADVLATNEFGHIPLINALFHDKMTASRILLDSMRRDPRTYDFNAPLPSLQHLRRWIALEDYEARDTLLHCAVRTQTARLVQLLLEDGRVDPLVFNHLDTVGERCTPFDLAVEARNAEIVQLFADMKNGPAFWPSNGAIQREFEEHIVEPYPGTVRILVDLYKQRKLHLDIPAATPAILAACALYETFQSATDVNESIVPVLSLGLVDLNAHDIARHGKTALHLLCTASELALETHRRLNHQGLKLELAHVFLDLDADWTVRNDVGDTVLHCAAAVHGFDGIVRRIIESATTPAQKDIMASGNISGLTPLHFFVHTADLSLPEHRTIVKQLIDAGCDPNARGIKSETVAHWAISPRVSADTLRFLVPLGVDLSMVDERGTPPMHLLATRFLSQIKQELRVEVIRYLSDQGADLHPGCRDCEGWVMRACRGTQYSDLCGR
jgi:ankyrin repeat protein